MHPVVMSHGGQASYSNPHGLTHGQQAYGKLAGHSGTFERYTGIGIHQLSGRHESVAIGLESALRSVYVGGMLGSDDADALLPYLEEFGTTEKVVAGMAESSSYSDQAAGRQIVRAQERAAERAGTSHRL